MKPNQNYKYHKLGEPDKNFIHFANWWQRYKFKRAKRKLKKALHSFPSKSFALDELEKIIVRHSGQDRLKQFQQRLNRYMFPKLKRIR